MFAGLQWSVGQWRGTLTTDGRWKSRAWRLMAAPMLAAPCTQPHGALHELWDGES